METHDFSNAKVGDKVSHPIFGDGEIINIDDTQYPNDVKFKNQTLAFSKNGKLWDSDIYPSLYHGHNTFQIIATPVSPYKEGEWIAVSLDGSYWYVEKFIKMGAGGKGVHTEGTDGSKDWNRYHKSLAELNAELNNK